VITQIGDAVWKHGFRKLFIVNGHVTNFAPLRCALEQLRSQNDGMMVAVLDTARLSDTIEGHFCDDAQDWHANRGETSVMMHMACDHVREGLRAQSDDPDRTEGLVFSHPVNKTSLNGVTGQPSLSSKDEGEQLWTAMLEKLHHLVLKGMKEEPPLSAPYHRTSPTS
jgi:creatinine amidohydrolase